MNLLEQELNKNNKTSSGKKKIVLTLLIVCIFMLIVLLAMITVLKDNQPVGDKVFFNNIENTMQGLIIKDESGKKYISIGKAAEMLNYRFFYGEYGNNEEDKDKCYLQNGYEAIGFELDSNQIYKVDLNSNVEPKHFTLNNKVIKDQQGNLLLTLEDFSKACNIPISISSDGSKVEIYTCEEVAKLYTEDIKNDNKYTEIEQSYYNLKAIYYGMLVVSDGTNYGVIDTNKQIIISPRYSSILFDEHTQSFIAQSTNKKYGIISNEGNVKIDFEYDDIQIINYSPLLYQVKQNNKVGVLDKDGNTIINIEYDKLGYASLLIIENINNEQDGMIVYKDEKYGIVSIETGEIILNCELEKIHEKSLENNMISYYVQVQGAEYLLEEYIKLVNTTVVNLPSD